MKVGFESVRFSYPNGVEAIRGVSLQIASGERVAIVGENGAGKTTLVRQLNGVFRPSHGTVTVGDSSTEGRAIAELAASVGYVFQNPDEQIFAKTVQLDVEFGPRNLGVDPAEATARAVAALTEVELAESADVHPQQLSLSERKRVALAGVLAMQTPAVVLDEPTTGQDARGVELIGDVVDRLSAQGRTIIAITHDMDFCAEHFERVIVMADGLVIADGDPRDVYGRADALAKAAIEPPQLIRLAGELGWEARPLTPEEFVDTYAGM